MQGLLGRVRSAAGRQWQGQGVQYCWAPAAGAGSALYRGQAVYPLGPILSPPTNSNLCSTASPPLPAATLVPNYVQPWQFSAFLRHGGTGCSQLYVPLEPPTDGYGAGMGAQMASQLARAAVQRFTQLHAQQRTAAGLAPLPAAELAATEADLRGHVQAALVAPRRGQAEQQLSQAEAVEELAWAAEVEGDAAEAARLTGEAAAARAAEAAAAQAVPGAAEPAAATAQQQPAPAPPTPAAIAAAAAAAEAERQRQLRQQAVQQRQQYLAAQLAPAEPQTSFRPPTSRRSSSRRRSRRRSRRSSGSGGWASPARESGRRSSSMKRTWRRCSARGGGRR